MDVLRVIDADTFDSSIGRIRFFWGSTRPSGAKLATQRPRSSPDYSSADKYAWDGPRLEDSFGRRLAYVYDPSGNSIGVQLIAAGYAKAWTRDGQHRDMFVGLEANAKANKAGCLWRTVGNAPTPPSTTAPVSTAIVIHTPTMVDHTFAVGTEALNGQFGGAVRRRFPEYANVWLVAVAVGQQEPTQQSFISFVRIHSSTTDLRQRAEDLISVISKRKQVTVSISLADRIVAPANQADADIGCWLS